MMNKSNEILIDCDNVSKKFCRDLRKSLWYGVRDSIGDLLNQRINADDERLRAGEFWANDAINFQVSRGDCVGLIGGNGAGKTTLLKMLSGLIKPDRGEIRIRGRVGALIALGAGFNPVLTGRENVCVNASVLGFSRRKIEDILESVVEFSELGEFIDSPVRTYSSGMVVRLGFAVASTLRPDVLLVDEVLAVGDAKFKAKSLLRISQLLEECAVVIVSHDASMISRVCSEALWLKKGRVVGYGDARDQIGAYLRESNTQNDRSSAEVFLGNNISNVVIRESSGAIRSGEDLSFLIRIKKANAVEIDSAIIGLVDASGSQASQTLVEVPSTGSAIFDVRVSIEKLFLRPGDYSANINLYSRSGKVLEAKVLGAFSFFVKSESHLFAVYCPQGLAVSRAVSGELV